MLITIENFPFTNKFGEKGFEIIKEAGFDGVDFSFNALGNGTAIDLESHLQTAKKTKELLDRIGLKCNQAHAPFTFKYGDDMNESNKDYRNVVRAIEYSAVIGAKIIVVHAIKVPLGVNFFDYNYTYYKSLEPYAKNAGVKIAVENLVNSKFWEANKLCGFIEYLDSSVFCACVDVGHAAIVGVEPQNFISQMKKGVIQCVHLHDTDGQKDRHWIPYQGDHDWDKIINALVEYDFNGDINLEVIHSFDNLPKELFKPLLVYTAQVGRQLKAKFNEYKAIRNK